MIRIAAAALLLAVAPPPGAEEARPASDPPLPGVARPDPRLGARLAEAARPRIGPDGPRTRHRNPDGSPRYVNRLALETSPYLLQHAHNPVSWYPWGDEAFERARREDKPVLLSIGYSTCHWCHVMEEESFEDVEIATLLNERFVAVKVDREERPDVDAVYMKVLLLLAGEGGWPMTLVLTPDREPFFAGTYIPARDGDRGVKMGFLSALRQLATAYRDDRKEVFSAAREIADKVREASAHPGPEAIPGPDAIRGAAVRLARGYDAANGGFGDGPKFPSPSSLALLARYHRRTNDPQAVRIVETTLARMAAGGIRDQLGGGFHRYAVDARWLVPHFEQMLYDNAQLAVAYLDGFQLTGRADFARVAREILEFLARDMSDPAGGFFSATDADSLVPGTARREEGRFFTWTPAEVKAAAGKDAPVALAFFGVGAKGQIGGRSVLHVAATVEDLARRRRVPPSEIEAALERARRRLLAARDARPHPARDEKVVAAWNGLAISAFARGALVLGEPALAARAIRAAELVLGRMRPDGMLRRAWKDGRASQAALLEDHAFLAQGLLDLHEATQDPRWLSEALALASALEKRFRDERAGGFFRTPSDGEALLAREKPADDGAEPSGNAVAILDLLRLHELTGEDRWRALAEQALSAFAPELARGAGAETLVAALDFHLDTPLEIVVVSPAGGGAPALEAALRRAFVPNRAYAAAREGQELDARARLVPLLEGKRALRGAATAYVCRRRACDLPTSDPAVFAAQLARAEPLFGNAAAPPLPAATKAAP
jgi:uncharacterized protein YyaL (SSP411 family)